MRCGWQVALQVRTTAVGVPSLGPGPATVVVKCREAHHDLPSSEEAGLIQPYVHFTLCAVIPRGNSPLTSRVLPSRAASLQVNSLDSEDWVHFELVLCGRHC